MILFKQENSERQDLVDKVNKEIKVSHPICYDTYDLCERYHSNTLQKFNVVLLRAICSHFEIPVKLREKTDPHRQTVGRD